MKGNERSEERFGSSLANRNIWGNDVVGAVAILSFLAVTACIIFVSPSGHVRGAHVPIVVHSLSTLPPEYLFAR
jgi:hypothetical protein